MANIPPLKGVASIPLMRGWRGLIIGFDRDEPAIVYECPHNHLYRDTADHCVAKSRRRWERSGIDPTGTRRTQ